MPMNRQTRKAYMRSLRQQFEYIGRHISDLDRDINFVCNFCTLLVVAVTGANSLTSINTLLFGIVPSHFGKQTKYGIPT